jgi:hypothetical protein
MHAPVGPVNYNEYSGRQENISSEGLSVVCAEIVLCVQLCRRSRDDDVSGIHILCAIHGLDSDSEQRIRDYDNRFLGSGN